MRKNNGSSCRFQFQLSVHIVVGPKTGNCSFQSDILAFVFVEFVESDPLLGILLVPAVLSVDIIYSFSEGSLHLPLQCSLLSPIVDTVLLALQFLSYQLLQLLHALFGESYLVLFLLRKRDMPVIVEF